MRCPSCSCSQRGGLDLSVVQVSGLTSHVGATAASVCQIVSKLEVQGVNQRVKVSVGTLTRESEATGSVIILKEHSKIQVVQNLNGSLHV